jgi:hypothetical protein
MTRRLLSTASLLLALTVGCGQHSPCPDVEGAFACVEGATLALSSEPWCEFRFTSADGLEAEARRAMEIAATLWDVDPSDYTTGWVVSYCRSWFVCQGAGAAAWTYGCAQLDRELIRVAPGLDGCATGVLIHELGHLVLGGDGNHEDPRFASADDLASSVCE